MWNWIRRLAIQASCNGESAWTSLDEDMLIDAADIFWVKIASTNFRYDKISQVSWSHLIEYISAVLLSTDDVNAIWICNSRFKYIGLSHWWVWLNCFHTIVYCHTLWAYTSISEHRFGSQSGAIGPVNFRWWCCWSLGKNRNFNEQYYITIQLAIIYCVLSKTE